MSLDYVKWSSGNLNDGIFNDMVSICYFIHIFVKVSFQLLSVPEFTGNVYCVLVKYICVVYLSRCSTDLRLLLGHSVCPRSSDPFYIVKIIYKMGHYFLDT